MNEECSRAPKATTELKQKVENRKQKCGPRPPEARYMRDTAQARHKPDTGRVEARGLGGGFEGKAS
jgi:hypothetical protein